MEYICLRGGGHYKESSAVRQEKKLITLYIWWSLLYLAFSIPMWIRIDWFSAWSFVDFLLTAILSGSHYQLWYILGLIYMLPILYLILKRISDKWYMHLSAGLYLIWLLYYSYNWLLPDNVFFRCLEFFRAFGMGLFLLLPYVLVGVVISRKTILPLPKAMCGFIVSFVLMSFEAFSLYKMGETNVSYLFLSYPTAYFMFSMILNIKLDGKTKIPWGKLSTFIYCFHPMVIETIKQWVHNSVFLFIVTVLVSSLAGVCFNQVQNIYKDL